MVEGGLTEDIHQGGKMPGHGYYCKAKEFCQETFFEEIFGNLVVKIYWALFAPGFGQVLWCKRHKSVWGIAEVFNCWVFFDVERDMHASLVKIVSVLECLPLPLD